MREISRAENWETVYKAFQQINFSAFDYNTVKHALLEHVKRYYPETFNDYIEDSEFIMILEIFAYISELFAYRLDMNAHENFIGTAQRKQNVLRLAQLISYSPSRNLPARGLVKITSVATTEPVIDSRGVDLSNVKVDWNDQNNSFWKEQFNLIMNRVLEREVGSVLPEERVQVNNTLFEQYSLRNVPLTNGVVTYQASVNDSTYPMEIVPVVLDQLGPYEKRPERNSKMQLVYSYDGIGDSSDYTGFFFYTKQGTLERVTREYDGVTPFQTETIDVDNINNTDVWINNINPDTGAVITNTIIDALGRSLGREGDWESVSTTNLQNIAFNTNIKRSKYQIETLEDDSIRIVFGDGEFSNIPKGTFDIWYRSSANENITIPRSAVNDQQISLGYTGDDGLPYTVTFTINLISPLANAVESESIETIRRIAPSVYQSQNRMVSGRDYNSFPLKDSSIMKVRTLNRTFAGHSRNYNWNDSSGTYQDTDLFAEDLTLYYETDISDINAIGFDTPRQMLINAIQPYLSSAGIVSFHTFNNIPVPNNTFTTTELDNIVDVIEEVEMNNGLGYPLQLSFVPDNQPPRVFVNFSSNISLDSSTNLSTAGTQYAFSVLYTSQGSTSIENIDVIVDGNDVSTIESIINKSTTLFNNESLDVSLVVEEGNLMLIANEGSDITFLDINDGALNVPGATPLFEAIEQATVGLDIEIDPPIAMTGSTPEWRGFKETVVNPFLYSFLLNRENDQWNITYNSTNLITESKDVTFWYSNNGDNILNYQTFQPASDTIRILNSNKRGDRKELLDEDIKLYVLSNPTYKEGTNIGLSNTSKLVVTTEDENGDFIPDQILLDQLFDQELNSSDLADLGPSDHISSFTVWDISKFGTLVVGVDQIEVYDVSGSEPVLVDTSEYFLSDINGNRYVNGSACDYISINDSIDQFVIKRLDQVLFDESSTIVSNTIENRRKVLDGNITMKRGRENLTFVWKHHTTQTNLLNPSPTNIHDMIIMTRGYFNQVRTWLEQSGPLPVKPTSLEMRSSYRDILDAQMLSDDSIIKHGDFKILFGSEAAPELQAQIKLIRASTQTLTDNDVINRVIEITRNFFNPEYWELGEKFYFSELATVIQGQLYTEIKSIVLVPRYSEHSFGDLYQITPSEVELFYPDIKLRDIVFVDSLNSSVIRQ